MNYKMIWQVLGRVLTIEAALMLLPLLTCLVYGENPLPFLLTIGLAGLTGSLLWLVKPRTKEIFAREGFAIVALSWVAMSLVGALPFVLSHDIPNYIDAVFETVSGFTTTGASILVNVETMSRGCLFWRSFTHWIGGMGVLVFMLAVLPMSGEYSMHIMRAEVPGPTVGKLVPRARKTAMILYLIYVAMTLVEVVLLLCGGMDFFDALLHAFATAGTGGFSTRAESVGAFHSAYIDIVIGVFMVLFGINFNLYFFAITGKIKAALRNQELWCFLGIVTFSTVTIAANIRHIYGGFFPSLRYSFFQVSSIISTTGFATANFDLWPEYSRSLLVLIMFIGACAGSTGGGIKVSRFLILFQSAHDEIGRLLRPRSVRRARMDGRPVNEKTVHCTLVFFMLYLVITFCSMLIVSLDGFDFTTSFTGVVACISNVGPGLSLVGPVGNYAMFSWFSKIILSLCMLLGRLEIYPVLILFSSSLWKRH